MKFFHISYECYCVIRCTPIFWKGTGLSLLLFNIAIHEVDMALYLIRIMAEVIKLDFYK
jgi:hypothetical protein